MAETFEQYIARIMSYIGDKDPIQMLQSNPKKIAKLVAKATAKRLAKSPAPCKWSVQEIIAHLADTEMALGYRLRKIAEEDGVILQGFDQDVWAKNGDYKHAGAKQSLAAYLALRAATVHFLKAQPKSVWERSGKHTQFGELKFGKIVKMLAGHDVNHLQQIEGILRK